MINRGGRVRIPFRRIPLVNPPDGPGRSPELKNTHEPTSKECAEVKRIVGKSTGFPLELIDIVMDLAEYWACSVASIDYSVTTSGNMAIHGKGNYAGDRNGSAEEDKFLLRTEPLGLTTWHSGDQDLWQAAAPPSKLGEEYPREQLERFVEGPPSSREHPFRKVVFDIVSHDQGWGGEHPNTFSPSWTWFDAGIDRFDKSHTRPVRSEKNDETEPSNNTEGVPTTEAIRPIWPTLKENASEYDHQLHATPDHKIQCNRVAKRDWEHYHIEWSWTDDVDPESSAGQELDARGRGSATGDGRFLRDLKVGDMLTVWGRARFPGWTNYVQKVQVQVYWAL